MDKEAEKKLVTDLKKILPEAGFITEEDTTDDDQKEFIWIIDTQDGKTNYIHGLPVYSISVGLLQGRNVVGGIVYELNKNELFYAWKGGGAFLNDNPIRITLPKIYPIAY